MSDIHNSQAGVIVKHDTKSSHKSTLHQPYSSLSGGSSSGGSSGGGHHPGYDGYPPPTTLNSGATDRYGRQMQSSPHQVQTSIQSSPGHKGGPSPPSSNYNMVVVPAKQKVSSPAPSHIYGKPISASENVVHSAIPHNRTQEIPHPAAKPQMLFQPQMTQLSHYPPPAHSSRPTDRDKLYQVPTPVRQPPGMPLLGMPHPLSSSPLPPHESHTSGVSPHHIDRKSFSPSPKLQTPLTTGVVPAAVPEQTQPLDLGVASSSKNRETDGSGRRKASTPFPVSSMIEPKKMRTEAPSHAELKLLDHHTPPPASVSPFDSPRPPSKPPIEALLMKPGTPDRLSVGSSPKPTTPSPAEMVKSLTPPALMMSTNSSSSGSVTPTQTPPPPALQNAAPTTNTPGSGGTASDPPKQSSFTAPRHLKKAWLQRHTGEDFEDTTGVVGSGNCIKLPLKLDTAGNPTPATGNGNSKVSTTTATMTNNATTNNNILAGNGKEEPVANNIKTETNSVSG